MEVTIEKTKAMKFSGNGRKCKSVFLYNGKPIENVSKYKYLGIEFRSSGSWSSAIANKSKDLGQFPIQSAQILTACG